MSKQFFKVKLFCYQNLFLEKEVISLHFKTKTEGEITILVDHAPLISDMEKSLLKIVLVDNRSQTFMIDKGILYFQANEAKIVANEIKELK